MGASIHTGYLLAPVDRENATKCLSVHAAEASEPQKVVSLVAGCSLAACLGLRVLYSSVGALMGGN